jgi:hypothetical protein
MGSPNPAVTTVTVASEQSAIRPAFLLSLPRSGSTLVQRVLATHPEVASTSEPWLLLQLLGPLARPRAMADQWRHMIDGAILDFAKELPGGREEYRAIMRDTALRLYRSASPPEARVFLDKTPPYHLIIEEIASTFPEAPLLFLWRNPLAVLASIIDTLESGRWRVYRHRGDLLLGIDNLVRGYEHLADRSVAVQYEALLQDPTAWEPLSAALGVDYDPGMLERFNGTRFTGRMGDPTGVDRYQSLSTDPLDKWRSCLDSPVRHAWARRWLKWIGRERLAVMGYDLDTLLDQLDAAPMSTQHAASDLLHTTSGLARDMAGSAVRRKRLPSDIRMLLRP